MAGKVFFSVTMSLDGFIAPESLDDLMGPQWMELQQWIFPTRFLRESLKLGQGGEEGRDNDIVRETFERTGASVMGKRMFDLGEKVYPEEVEAVLKQHPAISDAVVLGAPDEQYGQRVVALVAPVDGVAAPDLESLQTHCRAHLAGYKVPRALFVASEIPRSPAGKADYAWAREVIDA